MAASPTTQTEVKTALDAHSLNLYVKDTLAANAYTYLVNYDWEAFGPMPNHSWTSPNGDLFEFDSTIGAMRLNGTDYGSLSPGRKRDFFKWLNHFIRECLNNYDDTYNL